jgi:hypothetical protein
MKRPSKQQRVMHPQQATKQMPTGSSTVNFHQKNVPRHLPKHVQAQRGYSPRGWCSLFDAEDNRDCINGCEAKCDDPHPFDTVVTRETSNEKKDLTVLIPGRSRPINAACSGVEAK